MTSHSVKHSVLPCSLVRSSIQMDVLGFQGSTHNTIKITICDIVLDCLYAMIRQQSRWTVHPRSSQTGATVIWMIWRPSKRSNIVSTGQEGRQLKRASTVEETRPDSVPPHTTIKSDDQQLSIFLFLIPWAMAGVQVLKACSLSFKYCRWARGQIHTFAQGRGCQEIEGVWWLCLRVDRRGWYLW